MQAKWGLYVALLGVALLAGCAPSQSLVATAVERTHLAQVAPTFTVALPTATATITQTPRPTRTTRPTITPRPTVTPRPTWTRTPVPSPTPTPQPIVLEGQGDTVIDSGKPGDYPAIARINYAGGRNFSVWSYGPDGDRIDLLVNTIGSYSGTVPIDLLVNQFTTRFEISSSGSWRIEVLPLEAARVEYVPGDISGEGDEVLWFNAGRNQPDTMVVDATGARGNFSIWSYGNGRDLVVNEIAPYQGTVILSGDTALLVIGAEGPWELSINTR
jgi:hypothetical protein